MPALGTANLALFRLFRLDKRTVDMTGLKITFSVRKSYIDVSTNFVPIHLSTKIYLLLLVLYTNLIIEKKTFLGVENKCYLQW